MIYFNDRPAGDVADMIFGHTGTTPSQRSYGESPMQKSNHTLMPGVAFLFFFSFLIDFLRKSSVFIYGFLSIECAILMTTQS